MKIEVLEFAKANEGRGFTIQEIERRFKQSSNIRSIIYDLCLSKSLYFLGNDIFVYSPPYTPFPAICTYCTNYSCENRNKNVACNGFTPVPTVLTRGDLDRIHKWMKCAKKMIICPWGVARGDTPCSGDFAKCIAVFPEINYERHIHTKHVHCPCEVRGIDYVKAKCRMIIHLCHDHQDEVVNLNQFFNYEGLLITGGVVKREYLC